MSACKDCMGLHARIGQLEAELETIRRAHNYDAVNRQAQLSQASQNAQEDMRTVFGLVHGPVLR